MVLMESFLELHEKRRDSMRSRVKVLALVAALVVALCGSAFAAQKGAAKHVAVGTITSIDNNQVVINEKVNGKEQPMTFKLNSSTKKTGNLATGSTVRIEYRTENNQNVATAITERGAKSAKAGSNAKKSLNKEKKS
jgi:hypothetical protein